MQKSMRYHIADGENQPVVRAVALVVQREPVQAAAQPEAPQTEPQKKELPQGKSRWIRPALRKAHLALF
ncbi:MAG: hypothetical protein R2848_10995 [Thermomicrobiales bacterium]